MLFVIEQLLVETLSPRILFWRGVVEILLAFFL